MDYTSTFPENVDAMTFFNDVRIREKEYFDTYTNLINEGKYSDANDYMIQVGQPNGMFSYSADYFNLIENRIKAVQDYLLTQKVKQPNPFKYSDTEPSDISLDSIWL